MGKSDAYHNRTNTGSRSLFHEEDWSSDNPVGSTANRKTRLGQCTSTQHTSADLGRQALLTPGISDPDNQTNEQSPDSIMIDFATGLSGKRPSISPGASANDGKRFKTSILFPTEQELSSEASQPKLAMRPTRCAYGPSREREPLCVRRTTEDTCFPDIGDTPDAAEQVIETPRKQSAKISAVTFPMATTKSGKRPLIRQPCGWTRNLPLYFWGLFGFKHQDQQSAPAVFVNHTGQDKPAAEFAGYLTHFLKEFHQVDTFFDAKSLEPGVAWQTEIERCVCECQIFVCVISPSYFQRYWCLKELDIAFLANRFVLPVYHEGAWRPCVDAAFRSDIEIVLSNKGINDASILDRWVDNVKRLLAIQGRRKDSTSKGCDADFCSTISHDVLKILAMRGANKKVTSRTDL